MRGGSETTSPAESPAARAAAEAPAHRHTSLCGSPDRVVVGVDASQESVAALRWAGREAAIRGAHLHVVHAWQPPRERDQAERLVRHVLSQAFSHLPVDVESLTVRGHAAQALVAAGHGAALLVVGSQPRGTFAEVFHSVVRRTAAFATCPVAAVRQGQDRRRLRHAVMVGVDDSFTGRDALRWAAAEALRRDALLRVFHVATAAPKALPWETAHEARDMLEYLCGQTLTGPLAEVRLSMHVETGDPGCDALLVATQDADLLAVGSHGYGSLSGVLAGSVTADCLHGASSPVVVIPAAPEDERRRVRDAMVGMERESSGHDVTALRAGSRVREPGRRRPGHAGAREQPGM